MTKFLKSFLSQKILQLAILFSIQGVYIILNLLFPFLNGKFLDVLINADTLNNILDFIYVLSFIGIMDIFFSYTYKLLSLKIKSDIYVFDEPTSNLNNNLIEPFINYINYLANLQKTVIVISHDPKIINSIKNNIKL